MKLVFPDNVKKYIKLQCNDVMSKYTDFPELVNIEKELRPLRPKNVLEIGAGIGRASVFLAKYFGWEETDFYLLDGDSGDEQVNGVNYESKDSFYNSIAATKEFCSANGLKVYTLNAEKGDWKALGVKYDLVYSFLAIGFHWPISIYLDEIYNMLEKDTLLIFGVRSSAKKFDKFMDTQIKAINKDKYEIVKLKREPKGARSSVLLLRKK